ncbi:PREDICTED: TATA box-binding protein-associated factor RNA polymerase I subunit B [Ceratosolen solmsi marchali]|uniref:TATA box-binding protein-associated factor RNA polymerase I subunit B n=1 Tax=Ceratosolen solmsi marchali TaxID=326594 RepID=A0AAJ7E255_9HYME|nr:PREDICTED: TATA box-binding protein-associated factor RNA polymerase I subunit B [Ceratosolen solmsi marchali]
MLSQDANTQICALCNSTNFYKEDGYYFCSTCQTQNEDVREEVFDGRYDLTTKLRKIKIKSKKSDKTEIIGWTSWELYNFVLIGLTNQLIQIGADPSIKLTVLQLWSFYLTKLEVAFTSKSKKCIPKMARRYHKRDAEIIYGKIEQKKKKREKNQSSKTSSKSLSIMSSFVTNRSDSTRELNRSKKLLVASEYKKYLQSQANSDNDGVSSLSQSLNSLQSNLTQSNNNTYRIRFNKKARLEAKKLKVLSKKLPRAKRVNYCKKHVTTQYATGPDVLTPLKLLSILYLALRADNINIYISDLIRFCRESHLSYYNLDHLIPSEVILEKCDVTLLTQTTDITHKGVRRTATRVAKFLNVYELADPDFITLIRRFCEDLELPKGILLYAERLFLSSPSIMKFTSKSSLIPNYEGRAMAYIVVVLKTLFGLDDITETEISRVVEKINRVASDKEILTGKLFNFCEWQKYIECRKNILINVHFPSKMKYDPECVGTSHLYMRFMSLMRSKRETNVSEANCKYSVLQNLSDALNKCIDKLNDNLIPLKEMELFSPSFTPLQSYTAQLIKNPYYEIPNILKMKFYETKVGYMTKPNSLIELASQCGIKLKVVDCSLHYLEKIVPPFEQPRMPTPEELCKLVKVEHPKHVNKNQIVNKSDNLLDYSHRNRPCKLKVNLKSFKYYSLVSGKRLDSDETSDVEEDGLFDQLLPDGRLDIQNNSDSEEENNLNKVNTKDANYTDNRCVLNKEFFEKCNIKLYNHEIESLSNVKKVKEKYVPSRNTGGKFVKVLPKRHQDVNKKNKNKQIEENVNNDFDELDVDDVTFETHIKKKGCKNINKMMFDNKAFEVPLDNVNLSDSDSNDGNIGNQAHNSFINDSEILFRPYKNYWMYHCIFSRVKGKNFDLFEKELPRNFLWLLNECANIIEMTTEDLYEEVCLIEAYHFSVLKPDNTDKDYSDYQFHDCDSKLYRNKILNKW